MSADDNDNDNGHNKRGSATTVRPAHVHTNAPQIQGGHSAMAKKLLLAAAGGGGGVGGKVLSRGRGLWDLTSITQVAPKWAPPPAIRAAGKRTVAPHPVALALECARAAALERLRKKLNASATAAGAGAPPPQAFERWRFAAKLAEENRGGGGGGGGGCGGGGGALLDPVIPSSGAAASASSKGGGGGGGGGGGDGCVLTADLERAGVAPEVWRGWMPIPFSHAFTRSFVCSMY